MLTTHKHAADLENRLGWKLTGSDQTSDRPPAHLVSLCTLVIVMRRAKHLTANQKHCSSSVLKTLSLLRLIQEIEKQSSAFPLKKKAQSY